MPILSKGLQDIFLATSFVGRKKNCPRVELGKLRGTLKEVLAPNIMQEF